MQRHGLVPNWPGQAANRQQQPGIQDRPITHEVQIASNHFPVRCQEHRSFYPSQYEYEVVEIQTTVHDPNTLPLADTSHLLNFPIDHLDDHLKERAVRLPNLRTIAFKNPLLWRTFIEEYTALTERTLYILTRTPSLTKITLCADMLNGRIFQALSGKLSLREFEILLPPVPFYFPDRLTSIGDELNIGIAQLPQVKSITIPLELITPTLLSYLSRLPRLRYLKTTSSVNAPNPAARYFIACMGHLRQDRQIFGNLQHLDVRDDRPSQGDFFSKDTLTRIFPNTRFIET